MKSKLETAQKEAARKLQYTTKSFDKQLADERAVAVEAKARVTCVG